MRTGRLGSLRLGICATLFSVAARPPTWRLFVAVFHHLPRHLTRPERLEAKIAAYGPLFGRLVRLGLYERALEIVPELNLGAVLVHDHALLDHRKRVVPGPIDDQ